MNARVEERVEGWSSRPFSGGHAGLRDLADEEFSGVVEADDGTWLCMLNGTVVGVFDGRMADLEDAAGTAYVAPDPTLPLLFAMWEHDGSLEEQYYTQETPISQADDTLSSGGFSGYIELSNNVLSGDYYLCYYGDRSTSVAFIGSNERLVTGEEAFERADDEVGIYDVYSVDLDVVEVPDPEPEPDPDPDPAPASGSDSEGEWERTTGTTGAESDRGGAGEGAGPPDAETAPGRTAGGADEEREPRSPGPPAAPGESGDGSESPGGTPREPSTGDRERQEVPGADRGRSGTSHPRDGTDRESGDAGERRESPRRGSGRDLDAESRSGRRSTAPTDRPDDTTGDRDDRPTASGGYRRPADRPPEERPRENRASRERSPDDRATREDVDESGERGHSVAPPASDQREATRDPEPPSSREASTRDDTPHGEPRPEESAPGHGADAPTGADRRSDPDRRDDRRRPTDAENREADTTDAAREQPREPPREVTRLRERLEDHEATIDRLRDRIATLESDRDALGDPERLRTRVDEVDRNLSQLRRTVMRIDDTVEDLRSGSRGGDRSRSGTPGADAESTTPAPSADASPDPDPGSASAPGAAGPRADAGVDLSVDEALEETTVLVRYGSQSRATLKHAHAGESDRQTVNENLALNAHTSFEDSTATVDGESYREFLEARLEYRFFEWLVRELPYAISESGNESALSGLYDAIPRIDRAEFRGAIAVGEGDAETIGFDLVARDDRDRPLVAMNFHDSRDPATDEMVVELTEGAGAVCEVAGLNAAFLVTTSYFDGAAKDVVEEATGGSILSRNSNKSFVHVSRRRGYHLCLAAVSDGDFHLKMPDL